MIQANWNMEIIREVLGSVIGLDCDKLGVSDQKVCQKHQIPILGSYDVFATVRVSEPQIN